MSLTKTLEKLEDKFYGELEEDRSVVVSELSQLHEDAIGKGIAAFRKFAIPAMKACGGVYIPHIMWVELAHFFEEEDNREYIFKVIQAFVDSGFEDEERKKMKSLLISYFAIERKFEMNKIMTLIVEKTHPDVQDFFRKVLNFVEKNKTSVDMYTEKFELLKGSAPDFDLLRMPLMKLKEHLGVGNN